MPMWFRQCRCAFVRRSISYSVCVCPPFVQLATPQTTCSLCGRQETPCRWTPSLCHSLTSDKKILIMGTAPNSTQEQVMLFDIFLNRRLQMHIQESTGQYWPEVARSSFWIQHYFFNRYWLFRAQWNIFEPGFAFTSTTKSLILTSFGVISVLFIFGLSFHPFIYNSL